MPRCFGQDTHSRAEQQGKDNQHADSVERLIVRDFSLSVVSSQVVHGHDGDDEENEDDGRYETANERVDAAAAVKVDELVCGLCAQFGCPEEILERRVLGAEDPLQRPSALRVHLEVTFLWSGELPLPVTPCRVAL